MRKDRLIKLADYLETVSDAQFDMNVFAEPHRPCGFAGCAIGWAAHGKLFRGFTLVDGAPTFKRKKHWSATRELFEFPNDDPDWFGSKYAYLLFHPHSYKAGVTPAIVSKRIRKFVKDHEREVSRP